MAKKQRDRKEWERLGFSWTHRDCTRCRGEGKVELTGTGQYDSDNDWGPCPGDALAKRRETKEKTMAKTMAKKVSFEYGNQQLHGRQYAWWVKRNGKDVAGGIVYTGIKTAQVRSHTVARALFELERNVASEPIVGKDPT